MMIMIRVGIFYNSGLVYTHPLTHNFSTVNKSSLKQLSADIKYIYTDLRKNQYNMPLHKFEGIQEKMDLGLYVLMPLQVKYINKYHLNSFLTNTLPDCPDIGIEACDDSDILKVIMPNKEDTLVLMGLSLMLLRLSLGSLPTGCYRLLDCLNYSSLFHMGKIDRLYKITLSDSLRTIPINIIFDKVMLYVEDRKVLNLISSFLNLPIIDNNGYNIHKEGMPNVGEITRVIYNIVLMEIFDREFPRRFPGIAFSRYFSEVYIATKAENDVIFDNKAGYALLEELGLFGKIVSIGPGDEAIPFSPSRLIYVDSITKEVKFANPIYYY